LNEFIILECYDCFSKEAGGLGSPTNPADLHVFIKNIEKKPGANYQNPFF
jgi:hypothetical protein